MKSDCRSSWETLLEQGKQAYQSGRFREAKDSFANCVAEAQKSGVSDQHLAKGLTCLGKLCSELAHYDQAQENFERALQIHRTSSEPNLADMAQTLDEFGVLRTRQAKFAQAE